MKSSEENMERKAVWRGLKARKLYNRVIGSPYVHVFEEVISKKIGNFPVIAVSGAENSIAIALKALGVGVGDEVIVPAFCHSWNISPILRIGAIPVFVDIRLLDYALDPFLIEEKLTDRTKAIFVIHLFGQPALGMGEILEIAKKKSLLVIENAAQAFMGEATINGEQRLAGVSGNIGYFGFSKIGAGALVFHEKNALYKNAKRRSLKRRNRLSKNKIIRFLAKFESFDSSIKRREELAAYYTDQLSGVREIVLPEIHKESGNTWYRYIIRTKKSRELYDFLLQNGVSVHRPEAYFLPGSRAEYQKGEFPMSEKMSFEAVSLPIFSVKEAKDTEKVAALIKDFFKKDEEHAT